MAVKLCVVSPPLAKILSDDLLVKSIEEKFQIKFRTVEIENNCVYVPFDYFFSKFNIPVTDNIPELPSKMFGLRIQSEWEERKIGFTGSLTTNQKLDMPRILDCLNTHQTAILAFACGYGKTVGGVYLTSIIGLKTVVLCHRLSIINQWKSTYERYRPNINVLILKGRSTRAECPHVGGTRAGGREALISGADVIIINISNVKKYSREIFEEELDF